MRKIKLKSEKEVEIMAEGGEILTNLLLTLTRKLELGMRTDDLDKSAALFLKQAGAESSFKNYDGFPAHICVSINEELVHGLPGDYILKENDLISIDVGVFYKGFHTDSAFTHILGAGSSESIKLVQTCYSSLQAGISQMKIGNRVGDIGKAIEKRVKKANMSVIDSYCGHGIGRNLHEDPNVYNMAVKRKTALIEEGMVLAIEPIISIKNGKTEEIKGKIVTIDRSLSAHFEQTVAIYQGKTKVLTNFFHILEELSLLCPKLNPCLHHIF